MNFSGLCRIYHSFLVDLLSGQTECNVFPDTQIGQKNVLRNVADRLPPSTDVLGFYQLSIDQNASFVWHYQPQKDVGQGRFSRARAANNPYSLAGLNGERNVRQARLFCIWVIE